MRVGHAWGVGIRILAAGICFAASLCLVASEAARAGTAPEPPGFELAQVSR